MKDVRVPSSDNKIVSQQGNEKLFLSVQDIVDMTGISMTAVYSLMKGKIPAVPVKAPINKKWKLPS